MYIYILYILMNARREEGWARFHSFFDNLFLLFATFYANLMIILYKSEQGSFVKVEMFLINFLRQFRFSQKNVSFTNL
jgi:hypothetical protein